MIGKIIRNFSLNRNLSRPQTFNIYTLTNANGRNKMETKMICIGGFYDIDDSSKPLQHFFRVYGNVIETGKVFDISVEIVDASDIQAAKTSTIKSTGTEYAEIKMKEACIKLDGKSKKKVFDKLRKLFERHVRTSTEYI